MDNKLELTYLKKLGDGDHKAFDALFIQYHPRIKSFLSGFIKDKDIVSDMTQDLFFKVWINRESIAKVDSFKQYLFRMARNMIYDHFDHTSIIEKYNLKYQQINIHTYSDIIEEEIYARELALLIEIAIEKMPAQRKRIFIMSRKEGCSNAEIAEELKINKRTVENHITQALSDLRKIISNSIYFFL